MADNNSKKNRSGMKDKIVAAILVFLIFGAGTYGVIREAGNITGRADTAESAAQQGTRSGNEGDGVVIDGSGDPEGTSDKDQQGSDPAQNPEGGSDKSGQGQDNDSPNGDSDKDTASDNGQGKDPASASSGSDTQDPDAAGNGQDAGSSDDGTIPSDKRKLSAADVKKAFDTDKDYKVVPVTSTGAGGYKVDRDIPLRRFPTLKAGVVATVKAPATIQVTGFTDGNGWAQVSFAGYNYYVPAWYLGDKTDKDVPGSVPYVSDDVSPSNRFAAVIFNDTDPSQSRYVTKVDTPVKEDPSYAADDVKTLPSGTKVNVVAISDNGWAKVKDGDGTFYVSTAYLAPDLPVSDGQNGADSDDKDTGDQDAGDSGNTDADGNTDTSAQDPDDKSSDGSDDKSGGSDKSGSGTNGTDKSGGSDDKSGKGSDKSGTDSGDKSGGNGDKSGSGSDKSDGGSGNKSGSDKDKSGSGSDDKSGGSGDKSGSDTDKNDDKSSDNKDKKDKKDEKYPGELKNSEAKKLLKLINDYREANGVPKLKWSDSLAKAARTRSKEISDTSESQNQKHKRPNGKDWYTVNPDLMYGENIAYGQKSAEEVFKAFKKSSAHNETMLDPEYKIFAASLYVEEGTKYTYYWIQEFGY